MCRKIQLSFSLDRIILKRYLCQGLIKLRTELNLYCTMQFRQNKTSYVKSGTRVAQCVRSLDLATRTNLSSIRRGFAPSFVNYKKGRTRLAAASDKVYQLLAQGRWVSPGTLASSTTKTGRHDIAEILLKVALNTQKFKFIC